MKSKDYKEGAILGGLITLVISLLLSYHILSYISFIHHEPYVNALDKTEELKVKNKELKSKILKQGEIVNYENEGSSFQCHSVNKTLNCMSNDLEISQSFTVKYAFKEGHMENVWNMDVDYSDYLCNIDGNLNDKTSIDCLNYTMTINKEEV